MGRAPYATQLVCALLTAARSPLGHESSAKIQVGLVLVVVSAAEGDVFGAVGAPQGVRNDVVKLDVVSRGAAMAKPMQ